VHPSGRDARSTMHERARADEDRERCCHTPKNQRLTPRDLHLVSVRSVQPYNA
jgi:hypothetical protein